MNIPQEAISRLPWGMEIKVGDGVWVKPKGTKVWQHTTEEWDIPHKGFGIPSDEGSVYAIPVVLAGYELVKVGEVIPVGSMARQKINGSVWTQCYACGLKASKEDGYWWMRPIAAPVVEEDANSYCDLCRPNGERCGVHSGTYYCTLPKGHKGDHIACVCGSLQTAENVHKAETWKNESAPVVEPVKCPACGKNMLLKESGNVRCITEGCGMAGNTFKPEFVKRTTVAPEPLRCPCGDAGCHSITMETKPGLWQVLFDCGIRGKRMPSRDEAISEFRKLTYGGEA